MTVLLDIPPELIIRILCLLPFSSLHSCLLTHSSLYTLIRSSTLIKYHFASQLAAVEDNPASSLPVHDRLARLAAQERGWDRLSFDFSRTLQVTHDPSGIYDLTGGVYLLGNRNRHALHYCVLPSTKEDVMRWQRIDVDASIIDMGLDVYEHDLVAVITTTRQESDSILHNIEIVLLQLSTGLPHPHARAPRIFVDTYRWARPAIGIEIVGDTLGLITTHYQNPFNPPDNFYIFDWKTGSLRMHVTAPHNSYAGFLFLTPTLLLLPNNVTHSLEYWDVSPPGPFTHSTSTPYPPSRPIHALALPPLSPGYAISGITCRCEPNPVAGPTPHLRGNPFISSPGTAVAIFNVRLHTLDGAGLGTTFSMFVERETLVKLCPPRGSEGLDGRKDKVRVPPRTSVIALDVDVDNGEGVSILHTGLEGEAEQPTGPGYSTTPWTVWGPDATRWLNADVVSSRWITKTAGSRAAIMVENVGAVVVMDFSRERLKGGTGPDWLQGLSSPPLSADDDLLFGADTSEPSVSAETIMDGSSSKGKKPGKAKKPTPALHTWVEERETAIVHPAFMERVVSRLPYRARMLARAESYEGLLMDEERIIGLVTDEFGSRIREIVVSHLGDESEDESETGDGDEGGGGEEEEVVEDESVGAVEEGMEGGDGSEGESEGGESEEESSDGDGDGDGEMDVDVGVEIYMDLNGDLEGQGQGGGQG